MKNYENEITLIIPAKYESESLPLVLNELKKYNFKKIIIMQNNDIETFKSAENYDCEIIFQKLNGFGAALIEGIKNTRTIYSCIFNADGSFDPKYINLMLQKIKSQKLDFVFNSRYEKNAGSDDDTILTKIGNFFFTKLSNYLFDLKTTDLLFNYVLGKTKKFKEINLNCLDFTFCAEILIKAKLKKCKYISLPCHERSRFKGKKKVNEFIDGFLIFKYILKTFFKYK